MSTTEAAVVAAQVIAERIRARCSGVNAAPATAVPHATAASAIQQSAGRAELRVGGAELVLEQRVRGQPSVGEQGHLAGGEGEDVLQRALRDADRDAGDPEGEDRRQGHAQQRLVQARRVREGQARPLGPDEHVVGTQMMAAGAAQPRDRPGVVDLDLLG